MTFHRSTGTCPRSFAWLAAAFVIAVFAPSLVCAQTSRAEMVAILDSIAESPIIEGRVAGLAVAVIHGADTLLWKAYGKADLEWNVPMPAGAVFEIGSVTKQFTAAAILMLRDEGRIDLDADITEYLPDYPTQGHRIPVRRLLDHTSGIKGYTEMDNVDDIRTQTLPRDTLVTLIAAEPFDFAPGEALIYNNSAYFLLGLIIEKVSGKTYEEYVEEVLFAEIGMYRSSYCSDSEVVPGRAHGYRLTGGGLMRAPYVNHMWPYAAGSLCSTIGDLVIWLRALHGGQVLPAATYQEMITPGTLNDGTPVRYAMGLAHATDSRGRPAIYHGGAMSTGFLADTRYYPDADLMTVMLVNTTGNLSPAALSLELVDEILPRVELERRSFEGDVAELVGTYSGPSRGRELSVTVTATGDGIAAAPSNSRAAPLAWVEGWTFRRGGQLVMFEREGNSGPATVMRVDGGSSHYVLRRR